ncbi:MAG: HAMP domain-containing protein [Candidatus Viridilinea halotolerans]|uniref:histidine kinase n=1 Tax=Candidatus Viridilinea halotolerans TaxID=2491704 RepID=A0A426TZJ5_9CHLR|nr:MAG: HAMP domain-containing protein [Candidatus Viridilinea halotolerans]
MRAHTLPALLLRMVAGVVLGALLIIVAMTLVSMWLLQQRICQHQASNTDALARYGDQFLADMEQLVRIAGTSALSSPASLHSSMLHQIVAASPGINALYLIDPAGTVRAEATLEPYLLGFDLAHEPAFEQAVREARVSISTPFLSPTTGRVVATLAVPFFAKEEIQWVLLGELSLEELQAALNNLPLSQDELVLIVDQRGTVLAHPQEAWVQERRNLSTHPLFDAGQQGGCAARIFYEGTGRRLHIGSTSRMQVGWLVIIEQPLFTAMRPIFWMLAAASAALALSSLLTALLQRWGLQQISTPIARLAASANALASGRSQRIPNHTPHQLEELASLEASFGHMAEELQTTICALEQRISEVQATEDHLMNAVDQLHRSLAEKETLLKEIHHRVKNNLQVVISLLRLQARTLTDERAVLVLHESQQRIMTMALVHELLYREGDLAKINAASYLRELVEQLVRVYAPDKRRIAIEVNVSQPSLNLDQAVPCGLIVNELLSNSFKYAFPDGASGTIGVTLAACADGQCRLTVCDTGIGLEAGGPPSGSNALGMRLVQNLTRQLRGTLRVTGDAGTRVVVEFPL